MSTEIIEKQKEYMEKVKKINENKNKKYYILTMGCQLNENDSEKISGMLETMGYVKTDNFEDANLVVFNTCCIRENAEEKVFGKLGELKNIKAKNNMIICFAGCMSQEPHVIEKIKKSYSQVDIIFGTHNLYKFPEMLYKKFESDKKVFDVWNIDGEIFEGLPIKRDGDKSASVTIMNGCNNFCAYCIVPYTRGKQRSRKSEDILKEVRELKESGYKEITLLGQNVNAYGKDLDGEIEFSELLAKVSDIGIERIRFVTSHPWDFTDKMIDIIAQRDNIMPYIHLPLQSGSDRILKLMGRRYTKEEYLNLYKKIREKVKNVSITTDIIVAFPGETEEDFEETLRVQV